LAAAKTTAPPIATAATPYVTNFNIRLTHNIPNLESVGMHLHANFEIFNACGMNTCIKARFYETNMTLIKAKPISQYKDYDGYLCVFLDILPQYQHTLYSNLTTFIPYTEFSVPIGQTEFISKIFVMQGTSTQASLRTIAESPPLWFYLTSTR
jgi:hypothetical protein